MRSKLRMAFDLLYCSAEQVEYLEQLEHFCTETGLHFG